MGGIADGCRNDLLTCHINHGSGLNIDHLGVGLILHLCPGFQLCSCKYPKFLIELYGLLCCQGRDGLHHGADIRQASSPGLLHPGIGIPVSVENDSLVLLQKTLYQIMNRGVKILRCLQLIGSFLKRLRHNSIKHHIWGGAMESEEPTIRNSNLFPVKAKGDVLFRSVAS